MDRNSIETVEHWERALGDPLALDAHIGFLSALELDEQEAFPQSHLDALHALGAFEYLIPITEGGRLDDIEQLIFLGRVVARRDPTTAIAFGVTMLASIPLWLAGNAHQKAELAELLREGRLGCLALTEKEHGSDLLSNESTARHDGQCWRIDGSKWLINNGQHAHTATMLCRVGRPDGASDIALLWLRKGDARCGQWLPHPKIRTHGVRGADISGYQLRGYETSRDALVRGEEPALYTLMKTMQISRVLVAALSLGATDTLTRLAFGFARERRLYGKRALDIPVVRAKLAECHARLLVADLVAQVTSRAVTVLPSELSVLSAIAKYFVPTEAEAVARELAIVLGARHYVRDEQPYGLFQKLLRDNELFSLFDGSTQVNLGLIAGQLRALSDTLIEKLQGGDLDGRHLFAVRPLLRVGEACRGWPTQRQLQLSNCGEDSLLAAFFELSGRLGASENRCAAAIEGLDTTLREWLRTCKHVTSEQRAAHDSMCVMRLAERYIELQSCAWAVLAWHEQKVVGATAPQRLDDAALLVYLAFKLPHLRLDVGDDVYQVLVEALEQRVDGGQMLSLHDVQLCGQH